MPTELEQAWNDLQAVPSYVERDKSEDKPLFVELLFCLSCGNPVDSLSHECQKEQAA